MSFYSLQLIRVKEALGFEVNEQDRRTLKVVEMYVKSQQHIPGVTEHSHHQISHDEKAGLDDTREHDQGQEPSGMMFLLNKVKLPSVHLRLPEEGVMFSNLFLGVWMQNLMNHSDQFVPAGCCLITGDVEVLGSVARCKLFVIAAFNPQVGELVSLNVTPKQLWKREQRPKGGS